MEQLSDQSLFALIKTRFKESLSALAQDHKDWIEYDNLYLAKHWSSQRVSWRPDPVINYISYVVDTKAPQLTNSSPTGIVIPTSQGDDDVATIFTEATTVISDRVSFDDKIDELVRTGLLLGVGWIKVYWDNSIVGGSKAKGNLYKGDVEIDLPDPTNMYHDIQANCVDECRFINYAMPKPCEWIEQTALEMFGITVKIEAEQEFMTEIYNREGRNTPKGNMAMWYEYWYKDAEGVHCVYAAGGNILKRIPNASPKGLYPFVTFIPKKKRKSLLGIGEPKNLVNNQKLLNKLIEMPTTSAMFTSNPMLLVKANNGIEADAVAAVPGRVYTVKETAGAMEWVQPPENGTDVYKLAELLTTYIEKIGGIYDSNTGATPTGVTAAAAIQMLQDQASIPIKGIGRNLNNTIKQVYKLEIEIMKENYTETRHIRVMNNQGKYDFKPFKASLHAEVDLDVKIGAGGSTPTSTAYIAQLSQDLFKEGILTKSEYVNMQQGLPDKDKIVDRLRKQEEAAAQNTPKDVPSVNIAFKDMPAVAKVQQLAQIGITVTLQDIMDEMAAMQSMQAKSAPQQPMDAHNPALAITEMQMKEKSAQDAQQHDLQKIALQHQSNEALSAQQHQQGIESTLVKAHVDAAHNEQKAGHTAVMTAIKPVASVAGGGNK